MSNNNQPYPAERNCTYTIPYNQLSLADIFSDCQDIYDSVKPRFLSLLQQHIDLEEIVPASFRKRFYALTSRSRKYSLYAFLWALIIQRFFSIPTDSLFLVLLHCSSHLKEFCGFDKIPDAFKITRFKQKHIHEPYLRQEYARFCKRCGIPLHENGTDQLDPFYYGSFWQNYQRSVCSPRLIEPCQCPDH